MPSGVTWGRILHLSSPESSDRYYILVDMSGRLFTGIKQPLLHDMRNNYV